MSRTERQASAWPADYQIRVQGVLDFHWSAVFDDLTITHDANGDTTIWGQVAD